MWIPEITLEGTVADWESIATRAEKFSDYELDWWTKPLSPILAQFVDAAAGKVDRGFWDSIYKYEGPKGSGSPWVSGWVSKLFPYLQDWEGRCVPNKWIDSEPSEGEFSDKGPSREEFPKAVSTVPFKWIIGQSSTYDMEFIAGLFGVSQNEASLSLRPEIGWAVREVETKKTSSAEHSEDADYIGGGFIDPYFIF